MNRSGETDNAGLKASLTVEAALSLPLFIVCILIFSFFFRLMYLEARIQSGISRAAKELASYGYVLNMAEGVLEERKDELLSDVPFGNTILDIVTSCADDVAAGALTAFFIDRDLLLESSVQGGYSGVSFKGSELRDEDDCVRIRVAYTVKVPLAPGFPGIKVVQNAAAAIFSGSIPVYENEEEQEDQTSVIVYVAKNGTVYHTSRECTHLKLSVRQVEYSAIPGLRNDYGAKYYACEYCVRKKDIPNQVFITNDGDRFHSRRDCGGLSRYIREVELDSVDLPICQRCRAREQAESGKE